MKRFLSAIAFLSAVGLAPTAHAQVAIDVKAGYALPAGNVASVTTETSYWKGPLSNFVSGAIPLEIAGRYRFTPRFSAGVYFQYDPAFAAAYTCLPQYSCSAPDVRVGAEAVYGFLPDSTVNPWVSVGSGWEWLNQTVVENGRTHANGLNGWEWFNVQVGADWTLSRMFAAGPYVGFFGGQYSSSTVDGNSFTIASGSRQFHGWWQLGLKGTVSL